MTRKKSLVLILFSPLLLTPSALAQQSLTASQVIARMQAATGAILPADTVDTIKAGDPNTVVTGVATTFIPTLAVLKKRWPTAII